MKKDTYSNKLNKILGLDTKAPEVLEKAEATKVGRITEVDAAEIAEFRALQAVIYYLRAPQLFTLKACEWCHEPFLVSRRHVAYCSWLHMELGIKQHGFEWVKGSGAEFDEAKMEALINDPQVFMGQEPLWVRNLSTLEAALEQLIAFRKSLPTTVSHQVTLTPSLESEPEEEKSPSLSSLFPGITTGSGKKSGAKATPKSKRRVVRRA